MWPLRICKCEAGIEDIPALFFTGEEKREIPGCR
jgi:hypothetical protein